MWKRSALFVSLVALGLAFAGRAGVAAAADEDKAFDKRFVKEASQYLYAENEITRLAADKSNSDGVKHYAQTVLGGNKKLIDELRDVAHDHKYTVSEDLTEKQRDTVDRLRKLEGTNFDVQYMSNEVEDHKALVDLFERASKDCQDDAMRKFAERKLPPLKDHLANAQELYRKVKDKDR